MGRYGDALIDAHVGRHIRFLIDINRLVDFHHIDDTRVHTYGRLVLLLVDELLAAIPACQAME